MTDTHVGSWEDGSAFGGAVDDDRIIGRDSELAELERVFARGRSRLVLLVGGPNTGKGRLLRELRARAAAYPCTLVPADPSDGEGAPWLVVNKQSTVDDFRRLSTVPSDTEVNRESSGRSDFDVILIYGYRPDEDFHEWFSGEFIPQLARASPPRKVIVAAGADDVALLEEQADRKVVLGPLPREAVLAELHAIDAAIADKLQPSELEVYADAIVSDPSLLTALRHLLPLTPAGPAAGASG
jgi:hypothetical protein